jgi:hypothetical protein
MISGRIGDAGVVAGSTAVVVVGPKQGIDLISF